MMKAKRLFLIATLLCIVLLAVACGSNGPTEDAGTVDPPEEQVSEDVQSEDVQSEDAPEEAAFDWEQFSGTEIRVLWPNMAWTDMIMEKLPEFEALTGIDVVMETFVEDQLRQKLTIELTAGGSEIDIFGSMTIQEGFKYHQAGWYTTLDDLLADPTVTNPDFDFEDFADGAIALATVEGDLIGIPVYSDAQILFYRPSIFEEAGLEVPTTFEEVEEVAAALHNPDENFYAWINRGKGAAATSAFSSVLYSNCGAWQDEAGNPGISSPEAVATFEWYGEMLRDYGPPGSVNNSWSENLPLFTSGNGAMWPESGQAAATVLDPEKSEIADDVGFAIIPAGECGSKPYAYGWIMSIPPKAPNREAAWLFIQWALSKENQLAAQLYGVPAARTSAWESPEFAENDPSPELTQVMVESLNNAHAYMNPHIINVQPWRDAVGQVIVTSIEDGDLQAAIDEAMGVLEELLLSE
jgi:multiple sugar transport system substrate-binding protein